MRIDLRKFFEAYEGSPHQLAAVDQLADSIPNELLDKFSDWVVCLSHTTTSGSGEGCSDSGPSTAYGSGF